MSQHRHANGNNVSDAAPDECVSMVFSGYIACAPARCKDRGPTAVGKQTAALWLVGSTAAELTIELAARRVRMFVAIQSQTVVNCTVANVDEQGRWQPRVVPTLLTPEHTCSCSILSLETTRVRHFCAMLFWVTQPRAWCSLLSVRLSHCAQKSAQPSAEGTTRPRLTRPCRACGRFGFTMRHRPHTCSKPYRNTALAPAPPPLERVHGRAMKAR